MENIPPDIEKNTPPPGEKNMAPSEASHDLVATALQRKSSRERIKEILERNRKRKEERAARIKERETPSPSKNKEPRLKEGETPLPYDPASLAYDYNTYAPWLYSLKHQDDKHECFHSLLPTGEENPLLLELTPLEHTYRKGGLIPNYQAIKGLTRNELLVLFFLLSQFTPNTSAFVYTDTQLAVYTGLDTSLQAREGVKGLSRRGLITLRRVALPAEDRPAHSSEKCRVIMLNLDNIYGEVPGELARVFEQVSPLVPGNYGQQVNMQKWIDMATEGMSEENKKVFFESLEKITREKNKKQKK